MLTDTDPLRVSGSTAARRGTGILSLRLDLPGWSRRRRGTTRWDRTVTSPLNRPEGRRVGEWSATREPEREVQSHQQNGDHTMYPSAKARELAVLLRISRELDICGDLTATVDNPSELIAWTDVLADATVLAWRASDSGCRFVHVAADHRRAPVRGHVSAVLSCEQHPEFWEALHLADLEAGSTRALSARDLAEAWKAMPITPPDSHTTPEPPPSTQGPHVPDRAQPGQRPPPTPTSSHSRPGNRSRQQYDNQETSETTETRTQPPAETPAAT